MSEIKHKLTDYGKLAKIKLIELGKTQAWLINEINSNYPGVYADCSNINKIFTGRINSGKLVKAVSEILKIEISA